MSETVATKVIKRNSRTDMTLWWRWVKANAVAEVIGLGSTAFLGVLIFGTWAAANPLLVAVLMILGGILLEGLLVGLHSMARP